ncbi:hypothetical protein LCGC14_0303190 [marine sediment metagenome]|uniref:Uncharacterized protein n=1 Tax=marine sediment metagenome TaxID=412755 RepID=A0A0F9WVT1_9ZZZZ
MNSKTEKIIDYLIKAEELSPDVRSNLEITKQIEEIINSIPAELYLKAADLWGEQMQVFMAFEETAEFQNILAKLLRGRAVTSELADEIADTKIMMEQMETIYGIKDLVAKQYAYKIGRLKERVKKHEQKQIL